MERTHSQREGDKQRPYKQVEMSGRGGECEYTDS